jgi:hypothetical protein
LLQQEEQQKITEQNRTEVDLGDNKLNRKKKKKTVEDEEESDAEQEE